MVLSVGLGNVVQSRCPSRRRHLRGPGETFAATAEQWWRDPAPGPPQGGGAKQAVAIMTSAERKRSPPVGRMGNGARTL